MSRLKLSGAHKFKPVLCNIWTVTRGAGVQSDISTVSRTLSWSCHIDWEVEALLVETQHAHR